MLTLMLLAVLAALVFATTVDPRHVLMEDELLDKFVGNWRIERAFPNFVAENDAKVEWVVGHHYMRIAMWDTAVPSQYEAHVYISYERAAERYIIHWMDVYAGSAPEPLGYGKKVGDSIICEWNDNAEILRNTFAYHADTDTWTSTIEQTDKDGNWSTFCTDTYRRA